MVNKSLSTPSLGSFDTSVVVAKLGLKLEVSAIPKVSVRVLATNCGTKPSAVCPFCSLWMCEVSCRVCMRHLLLSLPSAAPSTQRGTLRTTATVAVQLTSAPPSVRGPHVSSVLCMITPGHLAFLVRGADEELFRITVMNVSSWVSQQISRSNAFA